MGRRDQAHAADPAQCRTYVTPRGCTLICMPRIPMHNTKCNQATNAKERLWQMRVGGASWQHLAIVWRGEAGMARLYSKPKADWPCGESRGLFPMETVFHKTERHCEASSCVQSDPADSRDLPGHQCERPSCSWRVLSRNGWCVSLAGRSCVLLEWWVRGRPASQIPESIGTARASIKG